MKYAYFIECKVSPTGICNVLRPELRILMSTMVRLCCCFSIFLAYRRIKKKPKLLGSGDAASCNFVKVAAKVSHCDIEIYSLKHKTMPHPHPL